jgi:hypothetical protein
MSKRKISKWNPRQVIYKKKAVDEKEYKKTIEELGHIFYYYFRQLQLSKQSSRNSNEDTSQHFVRFSA